MIHFHLQKKEMFFTLTYSNEESILVGWQFQKDALLFQKRSLGKLFGKREDIGQH